MNYPMVKDFIEFKMRLNLKEKTLSEYAKSISKFLDYYRGLINKAHLTRSSYNSISKLTVQNYTFVLNETLAQSSIKKELAGLLQFFTFLFDNNIVSVNPIIGVQIPKEEIKREKKFMQIYEAELLFDNTVDTKVKLAIGFAYFNGLRVNEIAQLRVNNINLIKKTMTFKRKNGKIHTLPIAKSLMDILVDYDFGGKTLVFGVTTRQIQNWFKTEADKNDMTDEGVYSIHKLRASCASRLYRDGFDVASIQKFLNHEAIATTMIYLNISNDDFLSKFNGI